MKKVEKSKYFLYQSLKLLGKPIFTLLYRPKIDQKYNIPYGEAIIFCGNHKSYLDPLLLIIATKEVIHFLAKKELFKGIFKKFFNSVGCIPVNRKEKDKNTTSIALSVLGNNKVIGIFPEGTRNRTNEFLLPFKFGAVSMAKKSNAWIIPFGISGNYSIFKNNLRINFGKPYKITKDLETENKELMEQIANLIKESYEK